MKQAIRFACVIAVLSIVVGSFAASFHTSHAQATAPLLPVDGFIAQITSSSRESLVGGVSGDGRLVVFTSTGDLATDRTPDVRNATGQTTQRGRNNEDGNREIFLFDYAQRRIFQITDTRSVRTDRAGSFTNLSNISIEVSNNRPQISNDGRFIVFTSNAVITNNAQASPARFDGETTGSDTALAEDGNQEIFLYRIPDVPAADLTSGAEPAAVNLGCTSAQVDNGTCAARFTRVTNTPASARPRPGTATSAPFVADDNRVPAINDDGSVIAFTSTRNLPTTNSVTNTDGSPEIFVFNRTAANFSQLTNTPFNATSAGALNPLFNENPSISGDGATIAFISNANISDVGATTGNNADNNAEVYLARLAAPGGALARIRQLTQTQSAAPSVTVNIFSPGRRLSRDGRFLAFESAARLEGDNAVQDTAGLYIVDVSNAAAANFTFTQVAVRDPTGDVLRFPTFATETTTGGGTVNTLVFTSFLNFRSNGGAPDANDPGLNPTQTVSGVTVRVPQIFATPVATLVGTASANLPANTFVRLTNLAPTNDALQPVTANSRSRIAFSIAATELGGGNPTTEPAEVFYLLTQSRPDAQPTPTPSPGAVSYFTGATARPVAAATASPTPTPSPLPADAPVSGLAAGMMAIARTTAVAIGPNPGGAATCQTGSDCLSETRRPSLPIQLNGVSISIGGAAAGLSFVSPNQINFVVPVGLAPNLYPVVINNNGTLIRSQVRIVAAQPDLASSTNGAGGRAVATNITNPLLTMGTPEPFTVTTTYTGADGQARTEPTRLRFLLTGIRGATDAAVTVRIGSTAITGDANIDVRQTNTPGVSQLDVLLPASLAGAGDVPVIVEVGGATSRPAETAPRIRIN